jgi:hypothetical protein
MRVSELTGAALDWAVAHCEGIEWEPGDLDAGHYGPGFAPSTDWAHGGPIIERERICLRDTGEDGDLMWEADDQRDAVGKYRGPTPLIAAMRCYVASVAGDEIDVPVELV